MLVTTLNEYSIQPERHYIAVVVGWAVEFLVNLSKVINVRRRRRGRRPEETDEHQHQQQQEAGGWHRGAD